MHLAVRTDDARFDVTLSEVKTGYGELVFLVRMWVHRGEVAGEPQWRGSVHEVASGIRLYVGDTRDIADFIVARMAEHAERADGG